VADYRVIVARSARKELQSLPRATADRVVAILERLVEQPRPVGARKLRGSADLWRVRVGDYRVINAINDGHQIIAVRVVRQRKDAYRS
jgi:mRNA interferase RelE/StbE